MESASPNILVDRIVDFANNAFAESNVEFRSPLNVDGLPGIIPGDTARNVLLIFKEAITNVLKHSGAATCTLSVTSVEEDVIVFSLIDDGHGIPVGEESEGYGMLNMRKRARRIGARFDIHATPGEGTSIILGIAAKRIS
ncbi:MAG: hypothetical protein EOP04_33790 [Proteobacteria bacterium]|nr:MAG: hypothetical protein EOP04_33790 [Pseudomonadota bacterium]